MRWDWNAVRWVRLSLPTVRRGLPERCAVCPWTTRPPGWLVGARPIPGPAWVPGAVLWPFSLVFSIVLLVTSHTGADHYIAASSNRNLWKTPNSLVLVAMCCELWPLGFPDSLCPWLEGSWAHCKECGPLRPGSLCCGWVALLLRGELAWLEDLPCLFVSLVDICLALLHQFFHLGCFRKVTSQMRR